MLSTRRPPALVVLRLILGLPVILVAAVLMGLAGALLEREAD